MIKWQLKALLGCGFIHFYGNAMKISLICASVKERSEEVLIYGGILREDNIMI